MSVIVRIDKDDLPPAFDKTAAPGPGHRHGLMVTIAGVELAFTDWLHAVVFAESILLRLGRLQGQTFHAELMAQVPGHPPGPRCPDPECMVCGVRDCPHFEPLHYHHDGCPACS